MAGKFDAVIVATGHYSVPYIPNISGLAETSKALPHSFEHSKAFRLPDNYVNKVKQHILWHSKKIYG